MTIPGFTAEASVNAARQRYQPAGTASVNTGLVHPAQLDTIEADTSHNYPFLGLESISAYPRIPCLRWRCIHIPNRNPWCYQTLGFWNHITHSCE